MLYCTTTVRLCVFASAAFVLCSCLPSSSWAQQQNAIDPQTAATLSSFTAIRGDYDKDIPTPQFAMLSGGRHQDVGALKEIIAFRALTGIESWNDIVGQGTIHYGSEQGAEEQAALEIRQPGQYRLDTDTNGAKPKTVRMTHSYGVYRHGDDPPKSMDIRDADEGLFAFPHLEEQAFPGVNDTLIDRGTINIEGHTYHRITLESPPRTVGNANNLASWTTLDLYFDPQTHLLEKSAGSVHGGEGSQATMLRVITYSEYQQINGTSFPMKYRETLNGQLTWTLELAQVQFNNGLSAQDFK